MEKFIIGIREHPVFGYIAIPLVVGKCNEEFCKIIGTVVFQDIIDAPSKYSELEKKIITITDNYSDEKIYSFFNKKKKLSITDYLSSIPEEILTKFIRPFIEKHIARLLHILKENNIEIYYKPYRYEHIYHTDLITINPTLAKVVFNFERSDTGIKYYQTVSFNNKEISVFNKKPIVLLSNPAYIELEHTILGFEKIDIKKLLPFYTKEFISVPKTIELKYFKTFILKTIREHQVNAKGFEIIELQAQKKFELFIENDWSGEYVFLPQFKYNNRVFSINHKINTFVDFDEKTFQISKFSRDFEWEKKYIDFLKNMGLVQKEENFFKIDNKNLSKEVQNKNAIVWITENYEKLEKNDVKIVQRFSTKKYHLKKAKLDVKIDVKNDWFDLKATVTFGEFELPFYKLKNNILNNERELILPNGEIAIIPEIWFEKYKNLFKFGKKSKNNSIELSKFHYFALNNTDIINNIKIDTSNLDEFFANPEENSEVIPKTLKTTLRDYQTIGYSWLSKLRETNFGGCLADDMGLGKTVQVLATILKSLEENLQISTENTIFSPVVKNHFFNLVIVPRSLLHNWLNEVKKNTPKIRALIYTGNERSQLRKKFHNTDLIITSYGIARNDIGILLKYDFNYIILDESQNIKNPTSKTYHALKQLKGENKIVMTGTPIENSFRDLWTQLDFVNKGLLGSYTFFRDNYITPLERTNDVIVKNDLKKIIAPFILRRTKEEVVLDLPEMEEQIIICEMHNEQLEMYEKEKSKIRNKIIEFYDAGTLKKSSIYVLQALTKLRQIASHPKMIDTEYNSSSGKFDVIYNRLETLIKNKHKVLIFSSFVKYLEIFEEKFKLNKLKYVMLTGKTKKRQEIIDEFQDNENVRLFLISIKAGAVGLNLTAADYVFVLDPWWNPAVERQAIARAHRIGQTKNVFAFKFITFGTVEEKIQKLQEKKLKIADEFIDNNSYFDYFSEKNIISLFE